jgi:hypothetical protein
MMVQPHISTNTSYHGYPCSLGIKLARTVSRLKATLKLIFNGKVRFRYSVELATMADWKAAGETKRDAVNKLIPEAWRLPVALPPPVDQRNVTGSYIQQFLSPREVEITESTAVEILKHTLTGQWKAVEVAEAFCHRAALAHQLVSRTNQTTALRRRAYHVTGELSS